MSAMPDIEQEIQKLAKPVKQEQPEEPVSICEFLDSLDDCEEDSPPSIEDQDLWGTKIVHPPRIPEGSHTPSAHPLENTDGAEMAHRGFPGDGCLGCEALRDEGRVHNFGPPPLGQ